MARLPAEAGRAVRRDRAGPSRPCRRPGGRVDRAHLRPGLSLSRPDGHARAAARAPGRRVAGRLDRGRDGHVGAAPAGLARADRSRRHQGRGLDLSVPVRHGPDGDGRHDLPQPGGGDGAGPVGHEPGYDRGPVPSEHGHRPRVVESLPLRSPAPPAAGAHHGPDAPGVGRSRSAGAASVRGGVVPGDPRRHAARLRRFRPRSAHRGARRGGGGRDRILRGPGGAAMKFYYFHLMPYTMEHDEPSSWVTLSNRHYDPAQGHTLYHQYLDQLEYAEALGWDGICVNEHHQNCYGTMPSPNVMAAMLVRRTTRARIAILGNGLPLRENPLRIAEEIAMLDVASGGRIVSGFVRGIGAEYYSTAVNPTHSRERFYEAADLILRAWTEPGPFSFDGRFYRYPYVNPWPRPLQQPHPPVWCPSQGSSETVEWAAKRRFPYLMVFTPIKRIAQVYAEYREACERFGYTASRYQLSVNLPICVAETDAKAEAIAREHAMWVYNV